MGEAMPRLAGPLLACLAVLALALTSVGAGLAAPAAPPPLVADDQPPPKPRVRIDSALRRSGPVKVVVELDAPSTTATYAATLDRADSEGEAARAARAQHAQIERDQQRLLTSLAGLGADVIYRVQTVYNGVALKVDGAELDRIAALPGVKAIHQLVSKELHHTGSVPLVGAPQVWEGVDGHAGAGVSIAIIDSGIDYAHRNFGGPGDYTGVTDTSAPAFNAKVVGGYDFVGDGYDARYDDTDTPAPDANPIDCLLPNPGTVGHGTHVAGTAAGLGVKSDGTTYTGAYDANTFTNTQFRIGPGVAPAAELYALRVFGCDGSTDVADLAIEWAVDPNGDGDPSDHLDVINMSLGSDFGANFDSTSVAAEAAVAAGVIVVASAGNSEDTNYITGSPGSADAVISVASSTQPDIIVDGITVNTAGPLLGPQPATFSVNYPWDTASPTTADVVFSTLTGCAALTPEQAQTVSGKAVLINWADGQCGSIARSNTFKAAGAAGLIIADNSDAFDLLLSGNATLPVVSMPKSTGAAFQTALGSGGLNVTFDGTLRNSSLFRDTAGSDIISGFSSRGPSRSGALKPDITAPGSGIFSVLAGSGSEGQTLGGTSMAAPHVAGAMAILREIHPDWTPAQLKALVMNTATNDVRSGRATTAQTYGPARAGAGRLDVPNAAAGSVIAYDALRPDRASVTFGNVEAVGDTTLTREVAVANRGTTTATYSLAYEPRTTIPGVTYSVAPIALSLAPGETKSATITLSVNPAQMKRAVDATTSRTQTGLSRVLIPDASGYLTLTPPAATLEFSANIRGYYENPPVESNTFGQGSFTFNIATRELSYNITFSGDITLSALGGHIHRGAAGANGPVAVPFPGLASATLSSTSGTLTLTEADAALLANGGLYVNFHTNANPGGEVRGQIVPADPALRLPVYSAPRPASNMQGAGPGLGALDAQGQATGTISLSGTGVNTGANLSLDTVSLASTFELQALSPRATATDVITDYSDLQYVGISSDFVATEVVSETTLFFGISTYGDWASFNQVYFEIQIYTDDDDVIDYALYTIDMASIMGLSDRNDVIISSLAVFDDNGRIVDYIDQYPINILSPDAADTQPYNTNLIILGVDARDLGLTDDQSSFSYQVLSDSNVDNGIFDFTPVLTYQVDAPGLVVSDFLGLPVSQDLPGGTISYAFNRDDFFDNGSRGLLLMHHHNASGDRVEVFTEEFAALDTLPPSAAPTAPLANVGPADLDKTSYPIVVSFEDNWLLDAASVGAAQVRVVGPKGFSQTLSTSLTPDQLAALSDASGLALSYGLVPPGGAWDAGDNGTYTVSIDAGQFKDLGENLSAAITLGTFAVALPDSIAPTAALTSAPNVTAAGATSYQFTVTYSDNWGVSAASIATGNLRVTGPNGFSQTATLVSTAANSSGGQVATYRIVPPGGAWDGADRGTYSVALLAGQVKDLGENAAAAATLGSFQVTNTVRFQLYLPTVSR